MKLTLLALCLVLSGCSTYLTHPNDVPVAPAGAHEGVAYEDMVIGLGFSMFPTILPFQIVEKDYVLWNDLEVGDIVVFVRNGRRIMHRLDARRGDGFQTRGDNNRWLDTEILVEEEYLFCVLP